MKTPLISVIKNDSNVSALPCAESEKLVTSHHRYQLICVRAVSLIFGFVDSKNGACNNEVDDQNFKEFPCGVLFPANRPISTYYNSA